MTKTMTVTTARPRLGKATRQASAAKRNSDSAQVFTLAAISPEGVALVIEEHDQECRPARCAALVSHPDIGKEVAVVFENGDPERPIIIGIIQPAMTTPPHIKADGQQVVIRAGQQIELQCGEASLTLTRAGKVILRGAYVVSRSTGVNRIKGASVQIN